ncbi:MAG: urea transporter [Candidatus Woesearchaeota archaeon]|jgi:urea transporter
MNQILTPKDFIKSIFRGIGQVMFQNNALSGLIFLIGIFYASWLLGIGAIIGTISGTLCAIFLKYQKKDILDGLYGFNGTLIGVALLFFFNPTLLLFILMILAIALSTIIMNFMYKKKLSPYTFPFIISTWIFIFLITAFNISQRTILEPVVFTNLNLLSGISLGFGQVLFQTSIITGLLFFVGILINSRISAIYALLGSVLGLLIGLLLTPNSLNLINLGIFGFNGVLCGIAFSSKNLKNILFAILSISLSVFVLYGFLKLDLIALTFPFILATWVTLFIKNRMINPIKKTQ